MLLAAQLLTIPSTVIGGYFLDKVKIWPILLILSATQTVLLTCFYLTSRQLVGAKLIAGNRGSLLQDISFTAILFLVSVTYQVNYTHFGKALKKSDISLGLS